MPMDPSDQAPTLWHFPRLLLWTRRYQVKRVPGSALARFANTLACCGNNYTHIW